MPYRNPQRKRTADRRRYFQSGQRQQQAAEREIKAAKRKIVTFRLDETLIARAQQLKELALTTGTYPWKTQGAVWRGLIALGFKSLRGTSHVADEAMPYLDLMKQTEGMRNPRIEAESTLHQSSQEIDRLLEIHQEAAARQFFHSTIQLVDRMSPTIWQQWLKTELMTRYPQLASVPATGVSVVRRRPVAK